MPRSVVMFAVAALVVGYLPLTGFDHVHLHIDHGLHFLHDHLHIGHHQHRKPVPPLGDHGPADPGDEQKLDSAVISMGQAAHVRPPAVEVSRLATPVHNRLVAPDELSFDDLPRPAWSPRAPPV